MADLMELAGIAKAKNVALTPAEQEARQAAASERAIAEFKRMTDPAASVLRQISEATKLSLNLDRAIDAAHCRLAGIGSTALESASNTIDLQDALLVHIDRTLFDIPTSAFDFSAAVTVAIKDIQLVVSQKVNLAEAFNSVKKDLDAIVSQPLSFSDAVGPTLKGFQEMMTQPVVIEDILAPAMKHLQEIACKPMAITDSLGPLTAEIQAATHTKRIIVDALGPMMKEIQAIACKPLAWADLIGPLLSEMSPVHAKSLSITGALDSVMNNVHESLVSATSFEVAMSTISKNWMNAMCVAAFPRVLPAVTGIRNAVTSVELPQTLRDGHFNPSSNRLPRVLSDISAPNTLRRHRHRKNHTIRAVENTIVRRAADVLARGISKDREQRRLESRRRSKARSQVEHYLCWAWQDKAKRRVAFDGYVFEGLDNRVIVGYAVKCKWLQFVSDRVMDDDERQSDVADRHIDGKQTPCCKVVFTRSGRKYAKRLFRQKRLRRLYNMWGYAQAKYKWFVALTAFLFWLDKASGAGPRLITLLKQLMLPGPP